MHWRRRFFAAAQNDKGFSFCHPERSEGSSSPDKYPAFIPDAEDFSLSLRMTKK
jgi:hypothetical protein